MSQQVPLAPKGHPHPKGSGNWRWGAWVLAGTAAVVVAGVARQLRSEALRARYIPSLGIDRPVTYSGNVAPILQKNCVPCHRPGQAAPFSLMTFRDVQKHASEVVEMTQSRAMPPWLPEAGFGAFADERRLTSNEKDILKQWFQSGKLEGVDSSKSEPPLETNRWFLGPPDLVVRMPQSYTLAADGPDVYRNFVIPVPLDRDRFVRAVEFAPGNSRIVHHAFIKVAKGAAARQRELHETEPGFPGMEAPAEMSAGQFLAWQPGKFPNPNPDGLSWILKKGSDLVLQVHLNKTGKQETLSSAIGLYFTDRAPTNTCFKMQLVSLALDFPADSWSNVVTDSFELPTDVQMLAVLTHAHYLAREMKGWAALPDGSRQWLLWIKNWDFKWQGDYRYTHPLPLPRGTVLHPTPSSRRR